MIDINILRSFRISGFAVFDLVVSYLGMYLLAPLLTIVFRKIGIEVTRVQWMYLMLPISVIVHLLIGQRTHLTDQLLDLNGGYISKIVILLMVYKGIKG